MFTIIAKVRQLVCRNAGPLLLTAILLPVQLNSQEITLNNRTLEISGNRYANDVEIRGVTTWIQVFRNGEFFRNFRASDIDAIDVSLGTGNDTFLASGVDIAGEFTVRSGSGDDDVRMSGVEASTLTIMEGQEFSLPPAYSRSFVTLNDVRADNCQVQCLNLTVTDGRFSTNTFAAAFQDIRNISTWRYFSLNDIDGRLCEMTLNNIQSNMMYVISDTWRSSNVEDSIRLSSIRTWTLGLFTNNGEDTVSLTGSQIMGRIDIDTGRAADDDYVYLNNVYCQGRVEVENGDGDDAVYMIQCEFENNVDVRTAGGADFAYCYNCGIGSAYSAQLGNGNDRLRFSRSEADSVVLVGGAGTQDRLELYRHTIRSLDFREFEVIVK